MKTLMIILLGVFAVAAYGQDFDGHAWEAPYNLPIPKDWTIERFPVPISFAPEIPYKGIEDIRFAPGWAKAKSEEYWTYAFLWYLDGDVKFDSRTIDSNLTVYYTGLIANNGPNIARDKLIPVVASFKEVKKQKGDLQTYTGTIEMLDYMGQKPMVLNCRAHVKSCQGENKTFMFFELSPQPFSHKMWLTLGKLWLDFRCQKD